jgi:ribonuclease BN (tRNA processing enzyme)
MLELKFLGTGSAFYTEPGRNAAYIDMNGKILLFDCGESTFADIMAKGIYNTAKEFYIMITHPHTDHIGSLSSLVFYNYYVKKLPTKIICDEPHYRQTIETFLTLTGVVPSDYEFLNSAQAPEFLPEIAKIELVPIKHSPKVWSQALHVQSRWGQNIYYTGDINDSKYVSKIVEELQSDDMLYIEVCQSANHFGSHTLIDDLAELVPVSKRNLVCAMHFDCAETIDIARKYGFKIAEKD